MKKRIHNPFKIPLSGWKTILLHVKDEISNDSVDIVSAGVTFYAFLAIFPALTALISIYGLTTDPQQIEAQLSQISAMMPQEAFHLLQKRIENFIAKSPNSLGWGTAIGILFSIWSANKGTKSLFKGIDIAYDTVDDHGFFKQLLLATTFTLGGTILIILCMTLIIGFPAYIQNIGLPERIEHLISWLRWPVLALIVAFFLCLIYQFAPARKRPRMKWVAIGAVLATILWLIASWGFSFYVRNYGSYGEVYGSVSAVVILLLWLFITNFIVLLGAELNSEIMDYVQKDPNAEAPYKRR
ncbi:YihY/virulence factor BrkB family protein [Zunongwangia sp. F363]|uniref:YihY/virulence factor BrkB family protein n=1 Tax=Autumnicola tepida TaxID=3075595 RepID=A0ABU3CBS8_9FLAO|nr:YihY/virulence factor BrkB family protein [Zunongwangia sp. F363]MDT0643781.1 YihY/virulence factor BrkB family protein [Zunongwangia sp. F363]